MTEHAQARTLGGIDIPKTIAGTLAAVSAAVVGSFLGVAGTLVGAAVASLISSIGTEIYHRYLDRGTKKLQAAFVTAPAAVGTPEVAAAEDESPSGTPVKIRWKRIAMVAGGLFLLAMLTLTTAELFAGRSAADATSGRDGGAPTVFNFSGKHSDDTKPAPATSATPGDTDPTPATTSTTTPGDAPSDAGTATTAPAKTATDAPADPQPTGDSDTGTGTGSGDGTGTGSDNGSDTGTGKGGDTTQQQDQGAADQPQQ
ncbi:hypothetical protein Acy02nite_66950 [Actinoplanes cyaneus]|uniref:Uncharacterized protein n=1 Tax=Actinoplanes cyaneus TaxID=52696 RepID=A0A919INC4_9ACTN|nr:hypothetical protein [Actinoplanes cyaneus]MCW2142846.1 hypothetical protein [Actinoplanes cyaneus]GID68814.1 hypothetical protein Acy02nite_66950 [Actinoplanes cyaneus]